MRVLLVNQYFGGDQTPTGRMANDLARALRERGHQPTALVGAPPHAYSSADAAETDRAAPVIDLGLTSKSRARRWSQFLTRAPAVMRKAEWDVAVLLTDPPFLHAAARALARSAIRRPIFLWTMDLYPEALAARGDLGVRNPAYRMLQRLNEFGFRRLEGVITLGERQRERLRAYRHWPGDEHSLVVPPWDHRPLPAPDRTPTGFRAKHRWENRKIALYAGNLGEAHPFEDVLAAARSLCDAGDDSWVFVFVCRGARKERLLQAADGLPNVHVQDYVSPQETADLLWSADVHLITMAPGWEGVVVPSKLYGCLATRAPTLFIGPPDADTANEIRAYGAGRVLPLAAGGDRIVDALTELVQGSTQVEAATDGPDRVAQFVVEHRRG